MQSAEYFDTADLASTSAAAPVGAWRAAENEKECYAPTHPVTMNAKDAPPSPDSAAFCWCWSSCCPRWKRSEEGVR